MSVGETLVNLLERLLLAYRLWQLELAALSRPELIVLVVVIGVLATLLYYIWEWRVSVLNAIASCFRMLLEAMTSPMELLHGLFFPSYARD